MWPEEGDFPENLRRVVYVIINKRSFESLMCLDLLLLQSLVVAQGIYTLIGLSAGQAMKFGVANLWK